MLPGWGRNAAASAVKPNFGVTGPISESTLTGRIDEPVIVRQRVRTALQKALSLPGPSMSARELAGPHSRLYRLKYPRKPFTQNNPIAH